ncbi:MAG: hypothetical protein IT445_19265 [Phycisphaeraceae bacterium]|nr:hypothetical protein [Phycisphaeraceae bacterium]
MPAGVSLVGCGPATVILASDPHRPVFDQQSVGDWSIRHLKIDGSATQPWQQRQDQQHCGLRIRDCWGYHVADIDAVAFAGSAIHIDHTRLGNDGAAFCDGGVVERVRCRNNHTGIHFDERGEYVGLFECRIFHNRIGCLIQAGNVRLNSTNICNNFDGVVIDDKENGSHGVMAHCLLNHNEHLALHARGVRNGMIIADSCLYGGGVRVEDSRGVHLANCQIDGPITIRGGGANALTANYIIADYGDHHVYELSTATQVQANFTQSGPWRMNRS